MEIAILILSIIVGGGVGFQIGKSQKPQDKETQISVALTNQDLIQPVCKPEYIEKHGNLLCREMFCRQQTRGSESQTSGTECESISNIINKTQIIDFCSEMVDSKKNDEKAITLKECIDLFDRRI